MKLVAEVGVGTVAAGCGQSTCRRNFDFRARRWHRCLSADFLSNMAGARGNWGLAENTTNSSAERFTRQGGCSSRWSTQDWARRCNRGSSRARRIWVRNSTSGCHGLHHDARMSLGHMPGGCCHSESRFGVKSSRESQSSSRHFFEYIAEEVRELLAELGFTSLDEAIGQVEVLNTNRAIAHWKADGMDLAPILHVPNVEDPRPS